MSILDQYKKVVEEENEDMSFPSECSTMDESNREEYEKALTKMRHGYSSEEVNEAIENSKKNMTELGGEHSGTVNENAMRMRMERITDNEMSDKGLLKECEITDIKIIRAYCPKCGKELVSKTPSMYNPFTMEKICLHECCGVKYNLDKTYPHIAYYDENGEEIVAYGL